MDYQSYKELFAYIAIGALVVLSGCATTQPEPVKFGSLIIHGCGNTLPIIDKGY
jgi:hypothetical protein